MRTSEADENGSILDENGPILLALGHQPQRSIEAFKNFRERGYERLAIGTFVTTLL